MRRDEISKNLTSFISRRLHISCGGRGGGVTSIRVCRNLIYYSTQHEGPPVRGPLFDFCAGGGYFLRARFSQISFVQWLYFVLHKNLQTLVTILIYKNFFGPLGYRPCHGPQSHYTQRKLGPKAPEWLRKSHSKSKP